MDANAQQRRRAALAADLATPRGEAPEWGRPGKFLVEIGGVRMTVEVDGLGSGIGVCGGFEINAVDPDAPFPSETGYRSFSGLDPVSVPLLECIVRTVARNMSDRAGAPTAIVGEAAKARAAERGAAFADLEPVAYPAEWADAFRSTGPNVIGRSAPKANPFPDGLYLQDGEFIPDKPASRRAATSFIGDDFSRQLRDSAAIDEDEDAIATAEKAVAAGLPAAVVRQVPFQPMFGDLHEDGLIAHTEQLCKARGQLPARSVGRRELERSLACSGRPRALGLCSLACGWPGAIGGGPGLTGRGSTRTRPP